MVRGEGGPLDKTLPMRLHVDTTTNAAQRLIFTAKKTKTNADRLALRLLIHTWNE